MGQSIDKAFQRGLAALQERRPSDAVKAFEDVLRREPRHAGALNLLAIVLTQAGQFQAAEGYLQRALRENPGSDATLYNYGVVLKALKKPADAYDQFSRALAINPSAAATWNNRGAALNDLKRYDEAVNDFDRALSIDPRYAEAAYNKGKALVALVRYADARKAFEQALALNGAFADAWYGLGRVHLLSEQFDQASAAVDRALALAPNLAEAWIARGDISLAGKNDKEAGESYRKAAGINPALAEAWLGQARVAMRSDLHRDALGFLDRAIALRPDFVDAWLERAEIFRKFKEFDQTLACYDRLRQIDPDLKYMGGHRLHMMQHLCEFAPIEAETAALLDRIRGGKQVSFPFPLLSLASTAEDQLRCARAWARDIPEFPALAAAAPYRHPRIRLGYFSADFHEHPVARLMVGVLEEHDRTRFEVTAIGVGADDGSKLRERIKGAADRFIDAREQSDQRTAEVMRELEIDIAVDLTGHTDGGRPMVFARRPAPIQVNYLGYASTMGAGFFDYIIADRIILPDEDRQNYSEQVAWLPDCYMPTDRHRTIAQRTPTRAECGLPEAGFVFCCFNNPFKITPQVFDIWMRLLDVVDGSVLWLSSASAIAMENLRREAERRGVARERLVFAPRLPDIADHLARHRQADLFLDTLPYNAHATACDALWAGLPMVTATGATFAGRVTASLLAAVGMPELVTTSLADYEALALKLARERNRLLELREKLAANRESLPLFDTKRFVRHIEAAYETMCQIHQSGRQPRHFSVDASGIPTRG